MARPRWPVWLLAAMLVLVTVALYWPATSHDFVIYDDDLYVTSNVHVQNGLSLESVKWACLNPVCCNWHPATVLSHMLVCQMFGLNPWGHHVTNILLHALNAGLVFALLQQMTGATWRSLLVAALFALHPLRVESVAWVSGRKDVLSGFFGLLALMAYARYATRGQRTEDRGPGSLSPLPSSLFYLLSLFFFALGLMSKPMLVTWPCVMLLLDYWPLGRMQNAECRMQSGEASDTHHAPRTTFHVSRFTFHVSLLLEKGPFFVLAALASVVTFVVQQRGGAVMAAENLPLGARVGNALISYSRYLGKLFWPTDLAVYYPYPGQWPAGKVALAGGLILGLSALVWVARRRYPYLLMGWLWFVGTLVPVIGLVQVGGQALADRYTYLPSLGMLILVMWGVCELTRRWRYAVRALSVAGGAAIVLCLALTRQQIGYWKDGETLFRHALEVTENNDGLHNALGIALDKKGQTDEAIRQYREAIRLNPGYALTHNNLGVALDKKGQAEEAIRQFQEAIRLNPDRPDVHYNLGTVFYKQGRTAEAIGQFQEALRLRPDLAEVPDLGAALGLKGPAAAAIRQFREAARLKPGLAEAREDPGAVPVRRGQTNEALSQFQETVRLKPHSAAAHYNLGITLSGKGHVDEAIREYQEAIRLKPDYPEAHNELGIALGRKGQMDEAIRQFQGAVRLKLDYADAHYNLGLALAVTGQTDAAIRSFEDALKGKPNYPEAHNHLGLALVRQGQTDEAIRHFQEALRLKPDYADARKNLDVALAARAQASPPPGAATNL